MQITLNRHLPIHLSLFRVFRIRLCFIFRIFIHCSSFTHTHKQKFACLEQFRKLSQSCQTTKLNSNWLFTIAFVVPFCTSYEFCRRIRKRHAQHVYVTVCERECVCMCVLYQLGTSLAYPPMLTCFVLHCYAEHKHSYIQTDYKLLCMHTHTHMHTCCCRALLSIN